MQARGVRRHQQLREAAADLLLEQGYDALTHRAVAARAGAALGTATYHFPDVEELRRQAVDQAVQDWLAGSRAALEALPARLTSNVAVARACLAVVSGGQSDLAGLYERYVQAARAEPLRAIVADYDAVLTRLLADVLRRGQRPARFARLVLASADGLLVSAIARGADDPAKQAVPELTRLVGLLPR